MNTSNTVLVPRIESRIQVIRGLRVMLDVDLASLYGAQTMRLNEQVKRNRDRLTSDFLFQLTVDEKAEVVANCDHLQNRIFSKTFAFTEHGVIQAANVLASTRRWRRSLPSCRAPWPRLRLSRVRRNFERVSPTKALRAGPRDAANCFNIDSCLRAFHQGYNPIGPITFRGFAPTN